MNVAKLDYLLYIINVNETRCLSFCTKKNPSVPIPELSPVLSLMNAEGYSILTLESVYIGDISSYEYWCVIIGIFFI